MSRELEGKVALVTGASRRLGRAIALRMAEGGAAVVVNARSSSDAARAVVREVEARGSRGLAVMADVTDTAAVRRMRDETIAALGRLDILVNTVAFRPHTPLADITIEEWRRVLASVLDGTFLVCQAFAPHLVASKGAIVNIGGASAHFGMRHHAAIMSAKMGLVGLTRSLAIDLGPDVVANCLIPGRVDGPGDRRKESTRYPIERVPAGRSGTLDEVAEAVAMLCNPRCRFITGQAVHVSGGMLFGL